MSNFDQLGQGSLFNDNEIPASKPQIATAQRSLSSDGTTSLKRPFTRNLTEDPSYSIRREDVMSRRNMGLSGRKSSFKQQDLQFDVSDSAKSSSIKEESSDLLSKGKNLWNEAKVGITTAFNNSNADDFWKGSAKGAMGARKFGMIGLGAVAAGTMVGGLGNILGGDIASTDHPVQSAFKTAATAGALGAATSFAGGIVKASNKMPGWAVSAAKMTQGWKANAAMAGAVAISGFAGAVNTNFTKALNANERV